MTKTTRTYVQTFPSVVKKPSGSGLATPERRKIAQAMYRQGESIPRIAQHFQVSPERAYEVVAPVKPMGSGHTQKAPEGSGLGTLQRRRIAREMYRVGESVRRVAWHFKVSYERAYEVVALGC